MQKEIKSIHDFKRLKEEKTPISVVTCYDYTTATLVDNSKVDAILIGDSVGMVFSGYESTVPVTLDEMIYHVKAVKRGAPNTYLIADLPYLTYHISVEDAVKNGGRMMKESGANAVKLEGGEEFIPVIKALVRASIPVIGHLGLTPQSVHSLGGYGVQGRKAEAAKKMLKDARVLQEAGATAIVLEMVPADLASEISESLDIPTIGIGAGSGCDGQVLVINDLLGMNEKFNPKFLKKYANLGSTITTALDEYSKEVKERVFPSLEHSFKS